MTDGSQDDSAVGVSAEPQRRRWREYTPFAPGGEQKCREEWYESGGWEKQISRGQESDGKRTTLIFVRKKTKTEERVHKHALPRSVTRTILHTYPRLQPGWLLCTLWMGCLNDLIEHGWTLCEDSAPCGSYSVVDETFWLVSRRWWGWLCRCEIWLRLGPSCMVKMAGGARVAEGMSRIELD